MYLALAYSSSKPCKFFMSECHTQPMHRIGPSSKSPATFAPSLSIRTPSPSHHRCLNSRQNPPQSLDCKFVKLELNHHEALRERMMGWVYLCSLDKEGFQEMHEQGSFTCISSLRTREYSIYCDSNHFYVFSWHLSGLVSFSKHFMKELFQV